MPQEQSQKSGEPPIGQCTVCGEAVTPDDPGKLQFSAATGSMTHVHARCAGPRAAAAATPTAEGTTPTAEGDGDGATR